MDGAAEALLEVLPPAASEAMRKAFAEHRGTYEFTECFRAACNAVSYPVPRSGPPLVTDLTPTQHALAQLVADEPFDAPSFIPTTVPTRRRWLGLDPPGLLEQSVRFTDELGTEQEMPLWRALNVLPRDAAPPSRQSLMRQFSVDDRLLVLAEVGESWRNGYSVDAYDVFGYKPEDLDQLTGQGRDWLPAFADRLASWPLPAGDFKFPLFIALVRANLPIKPEWDKLLPLSAWPQQRPYMLEAVRAIPDDRREAALVGALQQGMGSVGIGTILYAEFPYPGLLDIIEKGVKYADGAVKKAAKALLVKAGRARASASVTLSCTRAFAPRSLKELTPTQQEQLAKAGKRWDGKNLPAAKRLSNDKQDEQNLAGTLEVRELADAKGKHAYDAFTYAGDSGTVFKAGTTTIVAEIVQGGMECKNEALGDALEAALEAKPKKAAPKKAAPKKAAAKKAPKKKPAAKKPAKRK